MQPDAKPKNPATSMVMILWNTVSSVVVNLLTGNFMKKPSTMATRPPRGRFLEAVSDKQAKSHLLPANSHVKTPPPRNASQYTT